MLPVPIVQVHAGMQVVRDDLLPGGTKTRAIAALMHQAEGGAEFVYASPAQGYAQLTLAHCARLLGKVLPPFPSAACYDAKAWEYLCAQAAPGALFWNVGA